MTNVGISESQSNQTVIGKDQIMPANPESMVGKLLADRYLILGLLGSGAMGTVYKARHKSLNREMALKILRQEAAQDDMSRMRFEFEARATSCLSHSNLISVTDFGFTDDHRPFLVMDYIEGQSLDALLKQSKRLPDERILHIILQVCSGLAHAHDKGFVHRDLKPSNILLTHDEDGAIDFVKIVDFGLVKPIGTDSNLTHSGQIFGTPLYMSPEQCEGKKLDGRSDIYAIGCLLYRIVSENLPFSGETLLRTIVMHLKDKPPAIAEEKLTTPFLQALVPIIFKAMEKDPDARFQSALDLRNEIQTAAANHLTTKIIVPEPITDTPIFVETSAPAIPRKVILGAVGCFVSMVAAVSIMTTSALNGRHSAVEPQPELPAISTDASKEADFPRALADKNIDHNVQRQSVAATWSPAKPIPTHIVGRAPTAAQKSAMAKRVAATAQRPTKARPSRQAKLHAHASKMLAEIERNRKPRTTVPQHIQPPTQQPIQAQSQQPIQQEIEPQVNQAVEQPQRKRGIIRKFFEKLLH